MCAASSARRAVRRNSRADAVAEAAARRDEARSRLLKVNLS